MRSPIWKQFRNRILRNSLSREKSTGSAGQLALFFWFLEGILPTRSHTVLLDQCRKQQKLKSFFLKSQNSVPVRAAIHIPFSLSCLILTGQMVLFTIHWMEVRRMLTAVFIVDRSQLKREPPSCALSLFATTECRVRKLTVLIKLCSKLRMSLCGNEPRMFRNL